MRADKKTHPIEKKTRINVILILFIAVCIFCLIISPGAARSPTNANITSYDTIYIGEHNLDFSSFSSALGGMPEYIVRDGNYFPLTNGILLEVSSAMPVGSYYVGRSGCIELIGFFNVANLDPGYVSVDPYNNGQIETHPAEISKDTPVIFYVAGGSLADAHLIGDWNCFTLTNLDTAEEITEIKNIDGAMQSLKGVANPSDKTNSSYAFRIGDQKNKPTNSGPMQMKFSIDINELKWEGTYSFTAREDILTLADAQINQGETGKTTLTGISFIPYNLEILAPSADITIGQAKNVVVGSTNKTATVTPDWDGKVTAPILVGLNVPENSYTIKATQSGTSKTVYASIDVTSQKTVTTISVPSGDFVSGDTIKLTGSVQNPGNHTEVYIYYTTGTGSNGNNLNNTAVVDGDKSTFTIAKLDSSNNWEMYFSTGTLDAMKTYTFHANIEPVGDIESSKPGGIGSKTVSKSVALYLSEPTLQAKMPDGTNGKFVKGDYFYTQWYARGPLNSSMENGADPTKGTLRWYIFGTNYHYTDVNHNLKLFEGSGFGLQPATNTYGITYDRSFTDNLDIGEYYVVYQHPGKNNVFDINPDVEVGEFSMLTATDSGKQFSSAMTRQTSNLQYALEEFFDLSRNDDLIVISKFSIEEPWVILEPISDIAIGGSFTVNGATNYAAGGTTASGVNVGNTFEITIDSLDMYPTGDNTAMKMTPIDGRTTNVQKGSSSNTFSFGTISDTSLWYPGTYIASVRNPDTGKTASTTFSVGGQQTMVQVATVAPTYDAGLSATPRPTETIPPVPTPTPLPTSAPQTPVPTPAPTETPKAPGFAFAVPAILFSFLILRRKI